MKKLVIFTLAMVLAFSCAALAWEVEDNAVPVAAGLGYRK